MVKPVQPWNAHESILVTVLGIVIDVKPVHAEKADLAISVTLYITPLISTCDGISIILEIFSE